MSQLELEGINETLENSVNKHRVINLYLNVLLKFAFSYFSIIKNIHFKIFLIYNYTFIK